MTKRISSKMKSIILKSMLAVLLSGVLFLTVNGVSASAADDELTDETYLWENLTNPDEDKTGDVTLTVVTTEGETETYQYANIMDAVKKLFSYMNHGDNYQTTTSYSASTDWYYPNGRGYNWSGVDYTWDYASAVISFTEAHCEYITTSVQFKSSTSGWQYASLSNVTFDGNGTGSIVGDPAQSWTGDVVVSGGTYGNSYGYGSYSNLKGTITISGDNCTIKNTSFIGNHTWAFTYYTMDNAIGVGSDVTDLTIENNTFTGYTLVTAFGQNGGTVTDEVFDSNYVDGCLFLFHTADGGATNLTVTNNTLIGSAQYTLASCMAYTTIADFSGNTLTYASFGLQNCETDMSQFLGKNTYDHGFIYQETVDYDSDLGYYYLPSSTTVYTILPDGIYTAVWTSDYNTAGQMDSSLTYTQQDAINDAEKTAEDQTYATLTWTGGGKDEDGNLLDGGVAIGYNYTALHLGYAKVTEPGMDKSINQSGVYVDQDDVAAGDIVEFVLTSTVPDKLVNYIEYSGEENEDGDIILLGAVVDDATYILTFHDVMDEELSLVEGSIVVKIGNTILVNTEDVAYYSVSIPGSEEEDECTFEVSMDLLALYTAGVITESDFGRTSITVEYSATLSEEAEAGAYYNTAWVSYPEDESEKDTVEVDTYGIQIYKYDQDTAGTVETTDEDGNTVTVTDTTNATGLVGAVFELRIDVAYDGEDGEIKYDSTNEVYYKVIDSNLITDENGYITIEGLDAGTYYLVETSAPTGYVASGTVLTIVVPGDDLDSETNLVTVEFANAKIPETGGMGTTIFRIVGMSLLLAAGGVYVFTLRRRRKD